jgi:hypothetical protein
MNGFVVKNIDAKYNYIGIDACNPNEKVWRKLEEWNRINTNDLIYLEENSIIYKATKTESVLKYFEWLGAGENNEQSLFFFSSDLAEGECENLIGFQFIGYDCAYVENEYSGSILFSTIFNEMRNADNRIIFDKYVKCLNKNDLFDNAELAKEYISFREEQLKAKIGNLETAWKELNVVVAKVFYLEK